MRGLSNVNQVPLVRSTPAWGASAIQVFSTWYSPGAQPKNVILGNLIGWGMLPIVAFFQAVAWAEASKTCGSTFIQKVTTKAIPAALAEAEEHQGRRLHIINQCQRPMVMHTTGGNTEIPCASGCPKGLTCNPNTEQCYFDMPKLSTGWTIPAGAVVQLFTPNDPVKQGNGVTADWSGKLEFYPNVSDGGLPSSAICNGFERCPTYQGLNGVATAVEFTFVPHGADFYDISIINGFNIGIEMKPDGSFRQVYEGNAASQRGYNCGAAGATAQPDQRLSPCSWEFAKKLRQAEVDDITPLLTQVDGGYGSCTRHADCTGFGIVCGQVGKTIWDPVSQVYRPTTEITMECGHYIGSWTAYQLCVWSGNSYRSPPPYEGLIDCPSMHDMFACAGPLPWTTSCYSHKVPESGECCGCANWTENLGIPVPDGGAGCQGASPTWTEKAMPFYQILKAGCPTAYTYAFDDETRWVLSKTRLVEVLVLEIARKSTTSCITKSLGVVAKRYVDTLLDAKVWSLAPMVDARYGPVMLGSRVLPP
eukprot:symbB.v1.2.014590.t1/scaffold1071.1/size202461/3